MNVAVLTRSLVAGDAAGEHAVTLVGALNDADESVTVVTGDAGGRDLNAVVREGRAPIDGHAPYTHGMLHANELVRAAARVAPYDVLHAIDWATVPAGILLARRLDRPLVVTFQSTEHTRGFASADSGMIAEMEWQGAYAAAQVIATNDDVRNSLAFDYDVPAAKLRTIDPFAADWACDVIDCYAEVLA